MSTLLRSREISLSDLLYFPLDSETSIAVEVDLSNHGFEEAGPRDHKEWSKEQLSAALARGRMAAEQALQQFRNMSVRPDEIEIELGLKLSAEAGVVLAKTATEGHFLLKLVWRPTAG